MAKITIIGQAVVLTSVITVDDILLVKKYRPNALFLKGGEDGKEDIFAIDFKEGKNEINKFGITFGSASRDNGYAVATFTTDYKGDDIREHIADEMGEALVNLNRLEANLPGLVFAIREERNNIVENIIVE